MDNKARILDVIEHITTGRLLEGFEKYYAETCAMSENADPDQTRHGKATNREYETYFVNHAEFHAVSVGAVLADGSHTAYEMSMDFTMGGQRMQRTQWAVQEWTDHGTIAKETFYYKS